jgi:heme/copper-type cytochrome/quinol oxidase subunit 2
VSRNARIAAVAGTFVVLVIAFLAFRPSDEATTPTATETQAATTPAGTTTAPASTTTTKVPAAAKYTTIVVEGGKPVGGIKKITVTKGDQARIEVSSPDTTDEIHLHGYDLKRDLEAGGNVRFNFTADADGIYEIELEDAGVQIGELVVEPS